MEVGQGQGQVFSDTRNRTDTPLQADGVSAAFTLKLLRAKQGKKSVLDMMGERNGGMHSKVRICRRARQLRLRAQCVCF